MTPPRKRWWRRAHPFYACLIMLLHSTNIFMFRPALQLFVLHQMAEDGGGAGPHTPATGGASTSTAAACPTPAPTAGGPAHHRAAATAPRARSFGATPAQERAAVGWDMRLNLVSGVPAVLLAGSYGCASDRLGRRPARRHKASAAEHRTRAF